MAHEGLSDWRRQVAAGIAAAHPFTAALPIRATGNHLSSQNDEPEPDEAALIAADLQRAQHKAARYHVGNDHRAIEAQLVDFRAKGLL
jgi:hypothetical protein